MTVNLSFPSLQIQNFFPLWLNELRDPRVPIQADEVNILESEHPFIAFFTRVIQRFLVLGNIPIFDVPKITSMGQLNDNQIPVTLAFTFVRYVPLEAYKVCIDLALRLSGWMAQNAITAENKNYLFVVLEQELLKPLQQLVTSSKSTIPLLSVAHALDIPFTCLGMGIYQLGWGSRAKRLDRSVCDADSSIGTRLSQNKSYTANILKSAALPAPEHIAVGSEQEALNAAQRLGYPLVIKPMDLDRGEGISIDINSHTDLILAFNHAQKLTRLKQVLVERQVDGVCHRLFISHGKLLYAVKRLPMSIQGDGTHSIAQLVNLEISRQAQMPSWVRDEIKPIDAEAMIAMKRVGFTPDSIPTSNTWVPLRRIESTQDGGIDEDVTSRVHPDNVSAALEAANLLGLTIAGVDIITDDISRPWYKTGAVINEVNSAPLFGGGDISRSYIPQFFSEFIQDDGRIPIVSVKSKALALVQQQEDERQGISTFVTSASETFSPSGAELPIFVNGIKKRVRALIHRSDVDAIVVFE